MNEKKRKQTTTMRMIGPMEFAFFMSDKTNVAKFMSMLQLFSLNCFFEIYATVCGH
jgi:hypothetical protein